MSKSRHLIISTTQTPNKVVDTITLETDEASPNFERLVATEGFHILVSDTGDIGWTWSEEGGLRKA